MSRRALAALAALALFVAGCGVGEGESRGGGAELRVTRDFGQRLLGSERVEELREGDTAMRLLQRDHDVETRYGGRFVQAIDGLAGTSDGGRRDWFFFVNGREASVGAADYELAAGDVVQWDRRRWDAAMRIPAIVGAFPEPFAHGFEGERRPTRFECADPRGEACREAQRRLTEHDVPTSAGGIGSIAGQETLRVIVAPVDALPERGAPALLREGPGRSGVFARVADDRLELLDERGEVARVAPPGTGLVAATARDEELPTWLVTGVDEAGVLAAARALERDVLRDAFAVALLPDGAADLPLGAGGGE